MQTESYRIVGSENAWVVAHDGSESMTYATKEAAFEAAVAAASNAIKAGHDVSIVVQGTRSNQSALGGQWNALS